MKPLSWNEIDPQTGLPYTWDNPNLRWGDPSYVLEPGDYAFTSTGPHLNKQRKNTSMKHQRYYPIRVGDQILWLENFRLKINTYATPLGLTAAEVLEIIADCRWLKYVLGSLIPAGRAYAQALTDFAKQAQYGTGGVMVIPPFDAPPLPPAEPASVPALPAVVARAEGVLDRLFDIIAEIKENNGCTDTMCSDLGIIGPQETVPDITTISPEITAARSGNTVPVGWGWGGMSKFLDACDIYVDRGAGYNLLVTDTNPNYTDSHAHPASPAIWKYKAIYRIGDAQAGQWSQEVSVVVGG